MAEAFLGHSLAPLNCSFVAGDFSKGGPYVCVGVCNGQSFAKMFPIIDGPLSSGEGENKEVKGDPPWERQ